MKSAGLTQRNGWRVQARCANIGHPVVRTNHVSLQVTVGPGQNQEEHLGQLVAHCSSQKSGLILLMSSYCRLETNCWGGGGPVLSFN